MLSNGFRKALWAPSSAAAFLAITLGLPPKAHGIVCGAHFQALQRGSCSTTTSQGCFVDSDCPGFEGCVVPFLIPGDPVLGRTRIRVDLGSGSITTGTPPQVTINRLRFDLDCVQNSGFPCTDQGDVVEYLGDATITTNCPGVTWTTTMEQGGNEIVFTPSTPIVMGQNVNPGDTTAGGCSLAFDVQVANPEPEPGSCSMTTSQLCGTCQTCGVMCPAGETCVGAQPNSDPSPRIVEQVVGCNNATRDCTCSPILAAGSSATTDLPLCPICTGDTCGCDVTTGQCVTPEPGTSCPGATTTSTTTTTSTSTTTGNRPPNCSGAVASPNELSPPNHQFVGVSINGVTDPDGDAVTITVTGITQDEPLKGEGTGNTCPDAFGVGTSTANLRAERSGAGDGRAYHVSFRADDGKGGQCSGTVAACVPRSGDTCVDEGALADSTSCP